MAIDAPLPAARHKRKHRRDDDVEENPHLYKRVRVQEPEPGGYVTSEPRKPPPSLVTSERKIDRHSLYVGVILEHIAGNTNGPEAEYILSYAYYLLVDDSTLIDQLDLSGLCDNLCIESYPTKEGIGQFVRKHRWTMPMSFKGDGYLEQMYEELLTEAYLYLCDVSYERVLVLARSH